jgi:hypothetical protein
MNEGDGSCFATTLRFQIASPASIQPAFSPMRGSGLGGDVDMSGAGYVLVLEDGAAQAAAASSTIPTVRCASRDETDVMVVPGGG